MGTGKYALFPLLPSLPLNPYLWVDWGLYLIQPRLVLNCVPKDGFELSILPSMPLECVGMMVHLGCQLEWSWNQEKPLGTREGVS